MHFAILSHQNTKMIARTIGIMAISFVSVVVGTAYSGLAVASSPTPAMTGFLSSNLMRVAVVNGYYVSTHYCLDDYNGAHVANIANKVDYQLCNTNNTSTEQWIQESDNTFQINGLCLETYRSGTKDGTLVDLNTCTGAANQQWTYTQITTGPKPVIGSYELVNVQNGKCLTLPENSRNTQLTISSCIVNSSTTNLGAEAQTWTWGINGSNGTPSPTHI
jgi:hypothetical protein